MKSGNDCRYRNNLLMRVLCYIIRKISLVVGGIAIGLGIVFFTIYPANAQPQLNGYFENRFFITIAENDVAFSHLKNSLNFGDYNRARIIMRHDVSANSSLTVAVDYFTYHGFLQQQVRQPGTGTDFTSTSDDQQFVVDRAYLRLYFRNADVTIGKQRISWGRSFIWSPFDVFNRVNFFEPQEEKLGVNAFRISIPFGPTSSLEGVFVPENKFDTSSGGTRLLWNWHGMEMAASAIHFATPRLRQNIYGVEWRGDAGVGYWFEGALYNENPAMLNLVVPDKYYRWVIGTDYSFNIKNGLLLTAEYSHNESGEPEQNRYNYNRIFTGTRPLLARDYLYGSASLNFSDLLSVSATVLANLNASGYYFMPSLQYQLFPDTDLRVGTFIPVADTSSEFNPSDAVDPFGTFGNSMVYAWFKVYY